MRLLAVAALGAELICALSNGVAAQSTATAASVPRDDTALAPVLHSEGLQLRAVQTGSDVIATMLRSGFPTFVRTATTD
jgi:hypothetical protein